MPVHACSSCHGAANLFRMRVLRVFFVPAQFPVDRNYRRGNMKCKARQELCRTDCCTVMLCLLSTTDCYIVTPCPTSALASPFNCAVTKNIAVTPLESALTKSLELKPPEMNTYKKPGGLPFPLALLPFSFCPSLFPSLPALLSTSLTEILHSAIFLGAFQQRDGGVESLILCWVVGYERN